MTLKLRELRFVDSPNESSENDHERRLFRVCRLCPNRQLKRLDKRGKQKWNVSDNIVKLILTISDGKINISDEKDMFWRPKVICNCCQTYILKKKQFRSEIINREELLPDIPLTDASDTLISRICVDGNVNLA